MPFVYSNDAQASLSNSIAKDRLSRYIGASNGDVHKAILLYERNLLLSQDLHGVIQPLEIALRNSIHRVITTDIGHPNWYDYIPLRFREQESINDARASLRKWNKTVTSGRVVGELMFGFWTRLMDTGYEKTLWVPHLYKAFPHLAKPDRRKTFARFDSVRLLRNRVAHHEPIIFADLGKEYDNIMEAMEWICPTTSAWIRSTNTFQ